MTAVRHLIIAAVQTTSEHDTSKRVAGWLAKHPAMFRMLA